MGKEINDVLGADMEKIARELGRERGTFSPQFSREFFPLPLRIISFPTIAEPGTGFMFE